MDICMASTSIISLFYGELQYMINDIRLQVIPLVVQKLWDFKDIQDGDYPPSLIYFTLN